MTAQATTRWLEDQKQELAVDRILEAARHVFMSDGIRPARMGKIAEIAGCSRATLYRYFPNKDALLQAYMMRVAEEVWEILSNRLGGMTSFGERLVEATAISIELIGEREEIAPFFNEEGMGLTAQLASNTSAVRGLMVDRIGDESSSAELRGQLRSEVSPEEAAEWVLGTIFAISVLPTEKRSAAALREYLRKMLVPSLVEG